ncbi:MAG: DUF1122 family protein [Sulfolobales archaeon]
MVLNISNTDLCDVIAEGFGSNIVRCSRGRVKGVYEAMLSIGGNMILLTIFIGREDYSPWAEIDVLAISDDIYNAVDKAVEQISKIFGGYSRVMVTYTWDRETVSLLDKGIHPAATRIGSILISKGYYVVRNMYFPEGYSEGSPKLVGEGYVDNKWYLEELCAELEELRRLINRGCLERNSACIYADISLRYIESLKTIDKC